MGPFSNEHVPPHKKAQSGKQTPLQMLTGAMATLTPNQLCSPVKNKNKFKKRVQSLFPPAEGVSITYGTLEKVLPGQRPLRQKRVVLQQQWGPCAVQTMCGATKVGMLKSKFKFSNSNLNSHGESNLPNIYATSQNSVSCQLLGNHPGMFFTIMT